MRRLTVEGGETRLVGSGRYVLIEVNGYPLFHLWENTVWLKRLLFYYRSSGIEIDNGKIITELEP